MLPLDACRCPGTNCQSKLECARAIHPGKYEVVTWAALYIRIVGDKCDMFIKKD